MGRQAVTIAMKRFRFTLKGLLIAITAIAGCMGMLRLKFHLIKSDLLIEWTQAVLDWLPWDSTFTLLVVQVVMLGLVIGVLYCSHPSYLLWVVLAGHLLWFSTIGFLWLLDGSLDLPAWQWESLLCLLFFEPTCALVLVGLAWCLSVAQRRSVLPLAMGAMFSLSVLAEVVSSVELVRFGNAMAGILMAI